MPSRSLGQFKETLHVASELQRIERENYRNPPRKDEEFAVEGLRGGMAVLIVAGFERFLKNCFEEYLSELCNPPHPVEFARLPEAIRVHNTFTTLESSLRGGVFGHAPPKSDRLPNILRASGMVVANQMNPEAFAITGGNPCAKTVAAMLKSVGVSDFFNSIRAKFVRKWGGPVANTFIQDKLDEIVNRRHVVAHTADALNITRGQLRESCRFLKILAEVVDHELRIATSACFRAAKIT
jgi:hypothetical protein